MSILSSTHVLHDPRQDSYRPNLLNNGGPCRDRTCGSYTILNFSKSRRGGWACYQSTGRLRLDMPVWLQSPNQLHRPAAMANLNSTGSRQLAIRSFRPYMVMISQRISTLT